MKQRVADYIANFFEKKGMTNLFSVVGGGSMYLNDAFGNHAGLEVIYNHHEQASAMAAEAYFKMKGIMAPVCVTTGPGGTNALTGVLCAYQDSIPMFVISGQVRYEITVESSGLNLRQFASQEHQIINTVKTMTKYATMLRCPEDIRYELEKAYAIALEGRQGPVWIDVPMDIQGMEVEVETLRGYIRIEKNDKNPRLEEQIATIIEELEKAERPVIIAGSAIRNTGMLEEFLSLVNQCNIPVAYSFVNSDILELEHPLATGSYGSVGSRSGNFAVQNADLLVIFGSRMSLLHTGFNYEHFSPKSRKIVIDIDEAEQEKKTIYRDVKIIADVRDIIRGLLQANIIPFRNQLWLSYIQEMKKKYPLFQENHQHSNRVNLYYFMEKYYYNMNENTVTVLGNSSGISPTMQKGIKKQGGRIILNSNCGSMGYCLPAGIGAYKASNGPVNVITGDGSIQMNIQELETIIHNRMPIHIFILNNNGYAGVVATQKNFFGERVCGCDSKTGIGMPDFEKIANAYGFVYERISNHKDVDEKIEQILKKKTCMIIEVMQDLEQGVEPKSLSRKDENGHMISTANDDGFPFLQKKEYENNQYENWIKNQKQT